MKKIENLIKISPGHYIYKGYHINCIGYYHPEHRICWEAVDHDNCGFAHSFTLKDTINLIDEAINHEKKYK